MEQEAQQAAQAAADILPEVISQYRNLLIMLASTVGILGGAFAIFGYVSHTRRATIRAVRDDLLRLPAERKRLAAELRGNTWADRYERRLQGGLNWMERKYHRKNSRYALLLSVLLALVYAWVLFCLAWGFGLSDSSLLGQEILPPTKAWWRWLAGLGLGLLPLVLFYGIRWLAPRFALWQQERERRIRASTPALVWPFRLAFTLGLGQLVLLAMVFNDWTMDGALNTQLLDYIVVFSITVGIAGIALLVSAATRANTSFSAVLFSAIIVFTIAFSLEGAGTLAVTAMYAGAFFSVSTLSVAFIQNQTKVCRSLSIKEMGVGIVTILVVGLISGVFGNERETAIVFIAFQLVLPLANGLADWASLWVSRHLAGKLLEQMHESDGKRLALLIAWDLVRDLAAALVFLAFLAFVLAFLMQAISEIRGFGYDVTTEIARAAADPLGEGLWLALILFSTLIPTVFHAGLLLVRPLSLYGPPRAEREAWAETLESRHFRPKNADCQQTVHAAAKWSIERNDLWAILIRYGSVTLCYVAVALGIWGLWHLLFGPSFGPADAIAFIAEGGVWIAELAVRAVRF